MNKNYAIAVVLLGCLLLLGGLRHGRRFADLDAFAAYMRGPDAPYYQEHIQNGVKLALHYLPTEAMLIPHYERYEASAQRLQGDTALHQAEQQEHLEAIHAALEQARTNYERSLYFTLTIGYTAQDRDVVYDRMQEGFGAYSAWLQKLLFSMDEYVYLETPEVAEVPLSIYHMERSFSMTQERTFLLVFPAAFNGVSLSDASWWKLHVEEFGLVTGHLVFTQQPPADVVSYHTHL